MYKKNLLDPMIEQVIAFGVGMRIACGMLTAAMRSGYMAFALILLNAICILYYFDEICRTLFGGGSALAWLIIVLFKRWSITLPIINPVVEWLLHFPEYYLYFSLIALMSLIIVHIAKNTIDDQWCGVGRGLFRALADWRFILWYALFMSIVVWFFGDIFQVIARMQISVLSHNAVFMQYLYDPMYGKKMLGMIVSVPYALPDYIRLMVGVIWYVGSFLLFPVVVHERCSFMQAVWRSFSLAFKHIGLVLSAALFYLFLYSGVMAGSLYFQAATFPSLANLGMKDAQVVALFGLMVILLFMVHTAFIISGSLVSGLLIYYICRGRRIPILHAFYIDSPYLSSLLYLIFYIFYWIIIRCGIHLQMPVV